MKLFKFYTLIFLLFSFCGGTAETDLDPFAEEMLVAEDAMSETQQESQEEYKESPKHSSSDTNITSEETTTTLDEDIDDKFLDYYLANKMIGYINLTEQEVKKTYSLHMKYPSLFVWNEYTCFQKNRGMANEALLDEYFPVFYENEYYFQEFYTLEDGQNKSYVYWLDVGYYCKLTEDNSDSPEYKPLYGRPFYEKGKWWIFEEKEFEPIPVNTPGYYAHWATRVELQNFEEVYKEWVVDAISPKIIFYNCPDDEIKDDRYFLEWGIVSGNSAISYLHVSFWRNGDYETRYYFEKDNHSKVFDFPEKNTTTNYTQEVENAGLEGKTTYEVVFRVRDDYSNSVEESCILLFNR